MADGGAEARLSRAQRDLLVPTSHCAVVYGEPRLHSVREYSGKYWSLVISHLILSDTVSFAAPYANTHWAAGEGGTSGQTFRPVLIKQGENDEPSLNVPPHLHLLPGLASANELSLARSVAA